MRATTTTTTWWHELARRLDRALARGIARRRAERRRARRAALVLAGLSPRELHDIERPSDRYSSEGGPVPPPSGSGGARGR